MSDNIKITKEWSMFSQMMFKGVQCHNYRRQMEQTPAHKEIKELMALSQKKITTPWTKETLGQLNYIIKALREHLSCEDVAAILRTIDDLHVLSQFKQGLLAILIKAKCLQNLTFLFSPDVLSRYACAEKMTCFIDFCSQLLALKALNAQPIMMFLANEESFIYYQQIKQALLYLQKKERSEENKSIYLILAFPTKIHLMLILLSSYEQDEVLRKEVKEDEYAALITTYFSDHTDQNYTFGFDAYLQNYSREKAKGEAQMLWREPMLHYLKAIFNDNHENNNAASFEQFRP
jgi:hypothetical protein